MIAAIILSEVTILDTYPAILIGVKVQSAAFEMFLDSLPQVMGYIRVYTYYSK